MQPIRALLVACVALLAHTATGALMSIDLGSEFIKVCLVKPGRTPISIAVNEMSKRKSPALVGVVNGERLLGEEAFSFAVRYPESIFQRARDLLGKDTDDPTIAALLAEHVLPYKVAPHPTRGVASLQLEETVYSPEELVGSILYYARQIAEAQAGSPVLDAVVTVPAFFGQRQRQALADAAELAGLKLMGLINTHTAAALQYGIERDFTNRSQTIILYDMGSGTTEVALVKFSTYTVKEAGKPKVYNQLEVRDVDWDDSLGANMLDMMLARHFAKEFAEKNKLNVDVMAVPKAMSKLRRQVRRTKEMLSANTAAPCTVEELYDGKDFQSSITRDAFESLTADFFQRATAPLKRILERNGLQPGDIDAVELLGGGSRVPRLQSALSEVLGGRGLDRHLDADEAIALGAGLFAANLSTSFRLRKFGMVDMTMYGVLLTLDEMTLAAPEEVDTAQEPLLNVRNLLPYMKKLPTKRVVKLDHLAADPLRFSLSYNTSTPHGLPPGVKSASLAEWEVSGIGAVVQRYNTSGQVTLRFEADYSGVLRLEKVEAVVEYEVMEEKIIEVPINANETTEGAAAGAAGQDTNAGAKEGNGKDEEKKKEEEGGVEAEEEPSGEEAEGKASATEGGSNGEDESSEGGAASKEEEGGSKAEGEAADGKTNGDATGSETEEKEAPAGSATEGNTTGTANTTKPATTVKRIQVPKTKVAKVPLTLAGRGWLAPSLSGADLTASRTLLGRFVAAEAVKRDVAKSRNDLESYIIAMKESLETDELVQKVSTEDQRESFRSKLTEDEDWLYMEADESEGAKQFKDRLKALKDIGEPIKNRAEELELRPKVVEAVRSRLELTKSVVKAWPDTKPWISEVEREDITKQLSDLEAGLESKVAAQAGRDDHKEPAFKVNDVATAWDRLEKAFNKVNNKKKPKPPPEPKAEAKAGEAADGGDAGNAETDNATGNSDANKEGSTGGAGGSTDKESNDSKSGGAEGREGQKDAEKAKQEEPKEKKEDPKAKKEEPKNNSKAKKEESNKDSKPKKDSSKKDTKAKKEDPKKDSKAKKEEAKKDSKAKDTKKDSKAKEEPKKANGKNSGKKQDKKSWSWNNKKGKEDEL